MRFKIIIFMLLCACSNMGAAQQQQYLFTNIGTKDGLKEDVISAIAQDSAGFIWLASHHGLQRYDGQRIVNFNAAVNDPKSLPTGTIRNLVIDNKNRLWILTGQLTIGYFDVNTFTYNPVKVEVPQGISHQVNTSLLKDHDGNLILVFSDKTFVTYSEQNKSFSEKHNPFQLPDDWEPIFFYQDYNRCYWIGTKNGLVKYNANNKLLSYRDNNRENDPYIQHFKNITTNIFVFLEQSGRMWITAWPGQSNTIQTYSPSTGEAKDWSDIGKYLQFKYFDLKGVIQLKDGTIWLAGHNLFARINPLTDTPEPIAENAAGQYSIRYDDVNQLFEDKEKNVWICTNKGLFRFNPSAQVFRVVQNKIPGKDSVYTPDVTDLLQTTNGDILLSTWGNGIFTYDSTFTPKRSSFLSLNAQHGEVMVWCMIQRKNGDIWRGVQEGYVYIFDAAKKRNLKLRPEPLNNSTVRQLAEDDHGNVWLGTQGGRVVKWHAATQTFELMHQLKAIISRIYTDKRGKIWITTDKNGVYCLNAATGAIEKTYTQDGPQGKSLLINGASDIVQYNDSLFIIAAEGLNILNIKTNTFKYFSQANGLPSPNITNIVPDKNGYIWMSTSSGILSYHPFKKKLSGYTATDGVHTNTFVVGSGSMLNNGYIAFGTNHDLIVFDPSKVTIENYSPPKVLITGFNLMSSSLLIDSLIRLPHVTLPHEAHSFSIDLATLTYQNTYPIYYKLAGLDKDWVSAGPMNQAVFNYLKPGSYIFMTACLREDGSVGSITQLTIYIKAPFYKTGWFYALIILLVAYFIYFADRQRIKRIRSEQQIRANIAANLHDEVNTTLQNINVLSEIAGMKATNHPAQSIEYIEEIKTKSRNMVIAMNDVLWSIDPENDSMHKTIEKIYEWNLSLSNTYPVALNTTIDPNVHHIKLNMQKRHEFIVIYKLIISTLVEMVKAEETSVQIEQSGKTLNLKIYSTAKHIQHHHNLIQKNMEEIKRRAALLDARLHVQSDSAGTGIILNIKL